MTSSKSGARTEKMTGRQKSLILSILSQLRFGADMTKILIPVDFLEARSLTEKVTDFWTHGYLITDACEKEDPLQRMIGIVKWYLSCWHIGPQGVKKPYNPVLGEIYRCNFEMPDKSLTTFLAEQVSHHPPITAIKAENAEHSVRIGGWYYPRTKFLGNSAGSCAEGTMRMTFEKHDEVYEGSWPDFYARGIIYGKVTMEICGKTFIKCEKTGLRAEFDFKAKPFFRGEYNCVEAKILRGDEVLYTIKGKWTEGYTIKKVGESTPEPFFDCENAFRLDKKVIPRKELLPYESHVVWRDLTKAIYNEDVEAAADEKEKVEKHQRKLQKRRDEENIEYQPRFFRKNTADNYWDFIGDKSPVYKCLSHPIGSEAYEAERQKIDVKPFFQEHPEEDDEETHPEEEEMD